MTTESLLYGAAKNFFGVREVDGPASNPIIQKWILNAASWLDPDDSETAWCGCFRAALSTLVGSDVPAASYRAVNWSEYGEGIMHLPRSKWPQGATVVIRTKAGYHVALLDRIEGDTIYLLGGNQSNKVSIAPFPLESVRAVRIERETACTCRRCQLSQG
ncbi:MAG: TIGR02594 family protein [Prosthecobacter sp.]